MRPIFHVALTLETNKKTNIIKAPSEALQSLRILVRGCHQSIYYFRRTFQFLVDRKTFYENSWIPLCTKHYITNIYLERSFTDFVSDVSFFAREQRQKDGKIKYYADKLKMRHRSLNLDLKIRVMIGCSDENDKSVWCFVFKYKPSIQWFCKLTNTPSFSKAVTFVVRWLVKTSFALKTTLWEHSCRNMTSHSRFLQLLF